MKLRLNLFGPRSEAERHWPGYMFGGRLRTSTLLLIVAFLALWWVYDTYRPHPPPTPPPVQVAPPGFVPDPNYTWVPRSKVQEPPWTPTHIPKPPEPITTTPPPPSIPPVPPTTPPPFVLPTPPFVLPTPPCLLPPQFCPPTAGPIPAPSPPPLPGPIPPPPSVPPPG